MKTKKQEIEKLEKGFKKEIKNILFNVIFCSAVLGSVILFYKNIILTCIILVIISVIALIKWKSYRTLLIFIIGGFWGPISEILAIKAGVWSYTTASMFGVPFWLFLVWGDAAAFLYQTAREIKRIGVKDELGKK
jgi:hypothetical protein